MTRSHRMDQADTASGYRPGTLSHPFETPPQQGEALRVAPGVSWLRMPLPGPLDHVNLWLIDEDGGYAVIDTGLRSHESARLWQHHCEQPGARRYVTRVFVTHHHPDHAGMAGWLTRRHECWLWMTHGEYASARRRLWDHQCPLSDQVIAFYRQAGWSDASLQAYQDRHHRYLDYVHPLPEHYQRMSDGDTIRIGEHAWQVIAGAGHSPEHACLYCPSLNVLVAGDQVLLHISSNVSVLPLDLDANPLADRLAALHRLRQRVPADVLVLPAHNDCFHGLHERIEQLLQGQQHALERLRRALTEPQRAVDVFRALFARAIDPLSSDYGLATGEALACLNYLIARGEVQREQHDDVNWYVLSPHAERSPSTP